VSRPSNDTLVLRPRTDFDGPELSFELAGLEIGCAEYDEGPTGCTVFHFPDGASLQTDVRGGSPGTFGVGYEWVNAICLAGGSLYGLEAVSGVAAELFARREYRTGWLDIPLVAGAIIFDYGSRDNGIYPDKELGRAALRAARPGVFPLGARGAGRSATAGKTFALEEREPAGQGAAVRQLGEARIAVFTVVNSVGAIVDREGNIVRGATSMPPRGHGERWSQVSKSGS
jgi:6-aminohexanoate-oligomer endohydrolase